MTARWPDLAVLELLTAVSERGGLGAGARAVGMAQPNASRAIRALEKQLGVDLLVRHPSGSRVSEEGAVVVDWARRVLDAAREFTSVAEALAAQHTAHLDVAASMTVAEHLVPGWLAELRREIPDAEVRLRVHNSSHVFDLVAAGDCDLGFVETPHLHPTLRTRTVARDRLVVVVAPGHPWAARRHGLAPEELAATPLVVREPGSGTRVTLDEALAPYRPVPPALESGSNAAVLASVSAGADPAVLSELVIAGPLQRGDLIAIPVTGLDLTREIRAVWRSPQPPPAAAALIAVAAPAAAPR